MVHKRSKDKLLQRQIRRIIYSQSYSDRLGSETVSQVSRIDVIALLDQHVCVSDVPDVENGEILVDSRWTGSF